MIDYLGFEYDDVFFEGIGVMVFDYVVWIVYIVCLCCVDLVVFECFCMYFNFELICFDMVDVNGKLIYYMNVMMSVVIEFVMVGFDLIVNSCCCGEIV